MLVVIASVALSLDLVDGWVARRTDTVSELGARLDMELDALLILVLSVLVAVSLGPWVLLIGLMRYLFVLAGSRYPWLVGPLPPSRARKVVAAVQGVVLVAATRAGPAAVAGDGGGARGAAVAALVVRPRHALVGGPNPLTRPVPAKMGGWSARGCCCPSRCRSTAASTTRPTTG